MLTNNQGCGNIQLQGQGIGVISQNITERSDLNLKEKTTNKNCPYCRYDNIVAFVMKHTTSNRPVEEYIPVNFCPKCGANLTEYLNDRLTYFLPKRRKM